MTGRHFTLGGTNVISRFAVLVNHSLVNHSLSIWSISISVLEDPDKPQTYCGELRNR